MKRIHFSTRVNEDGTIAIPRARPFPTGLVNVTVTSQPSAIPLTAAELAYRQGTPHLIELNWDSGAWAAVDRGPTTSGIPSLREPPGGLTVGYCDDQSSLLAVRQLGRPDQEPVETLDSNNQLTYVLRPVQRRQWALVVPQQTAVLEIRHPVDGVVARVPIAAPTALTVTGAAAAPQFPRETIHGPGDGVVDEMHVDLVLVSDGYTESELDKFRELCSNFVKMLKSEPWFDAHLSALRILRIDVPSNGIGLGTALPRGSRQVVFDAPKLAQFVDAQLGSREWNVAVLLVKGRQFGATASPSNHSVAVMLPDQRNSESGKPLWFEYLMHELGHTAFGLADEYEFYESVARNSAGEFFASIGSDLASPNVTDNPNRDQLKWRDLAQLSDDQPLTQKNQSCGNGPPALEPALPIGMFEGGHYRPTGIFRPAKTCRMRELQQPYCRVCVQAIHSALRRFHPQPLLTAEQLQIPFGNLLINQSWTIPLAITNVGTGAATNFRATIVDDGSGDPPSFALESSLKTEDVAEGEWRIINVIAGPISILGKRRGTLRIEWGPQGQSLEVPLCVCVLNFTDV